ncbi:MAG: sigma-54-dependent Fis family transcriptional regulator, partial [Myxococcales bacterium]|nr:sigma-54-dependent Fis family transcriptional regulator [Myxococcales bacterium]
LLPLEAVERAHIRRVMAAVSGNKSMAAQVLGVDRSTLYRKLEKLADGDDDLF